MQNLDAEKKSRAAAGPAERPSLIKNGSTPWAPIAGGSESTLRMLDGLDSGKQPSVAHRGARPASWTTPAALIALILAAGAAAWWWQHGYKRLDESSIARNAVVESRSRPMPSPEMVQGRGHVQIPRAPEPESASAQPIGAPTELPTTINVARIESAADSVPTRAEQIVIPPVAIPPLSPVDASAHVGPALTARSNHARPKARPLVANSVPRGRSAKAASVKIAATTPRDGTPSNSGDADVLLLNAMLTHVTSDGASQDSGAPEVMTIAQLVRRCEGPDGKETGETLACKRHICDGYWGKAEACPALPAAKRH